MLTSMISANKIADQAGGEEVGLTARRRHLPAQSRHDAHREGMVQPEGVPDRQGTLTHLHNAYIQHSNESQGHEAAVVFKSRAGGASPGLD